MKREALRKAGVKYVEVGPADTAEQIRNRICEALGWNQAAPASAPIRPNGFNRALQTGEPTA